MNFSLKYRIAFVIFLLEAILMYFVLGPVLNTALKETQKQLEITEHVMLDLLSDLGRIALFTSEYDELQPYIESVVLDPHVEVIYLANVKQLVVVSSDVTKVGQQLPDLTSSLNSFWRTKQIRNSSGQLGTLAIKFSHKELSDIIERTRRKGITTALVGMSIIAIIGIIMVFLLTRRLEQLSIASKNVAQGIYDQELEIKGRDEIAMLGHSFEQMRQKIRKNITELNRNRDELQMAKTGLEQRVQERTSELAIARDKALEANKMKSAFIANMSHELRTPLNIILGYSDLLEADLVEANKLEMAADVGKIKDSGKQLLEIVNNVFDLSRIEVGEMELRLEEENIIAYLNDIVSRVQPWFKKNGNQFEAINNISNETVVTDMPKIRKILFNILENANKFTQNGKVTLEAYNENIDDNAMVVFKITDTGIGIDPSRTQDLFVAFYQIDSSTSRAYEGIGLGLTISKKYCEMLGGNIDIQSEPGKGTVVTVTIPQISKPLN